MYILLLRLHKFAFIKAKMPGREKREEGDFLLVLKSGAQFNFSPKCAVLKVLRLFCGT